MNESFDFINTFFNLEKDSGGNSILKFSKKNEVIRELMAFPDFNIRNLVH